MCKVIMFGLVSLVEHHCDCESFLFEDFDRVNWCVEDWHLGHPPLPHRYVSKLAATQTLLGAYWAREEPVASELQLEEYREAVILLK